MARKAKALSTKGPASKSPSAPAILRLPRTDGALWRDIRDNFGVPLPREPVCGDHSCPFELVCDIYFEKHPDDVLVYANRKGYKSLSTSLLITLLMRDSRTPIEILNLGGNKEQAQRVLEYSTKAWRGYAHAGEYLAARGLQRNSIRLLNGSNVEIVPASIKNVHGPSKNLLIIDEVDCFDDKERGRARGQVEGEIQDAGELGLNQIIQGAMSVTASQIAVEGIAGRPPRDRERVGRLVLLSTFHNPFGTMSKLVDHREMLGLRLYKWCFLDTTERCTETWDCES